jgi:adenylate cyclase
MLAEAINDGAEFTQDEIPDVVWDIYESMSYNYKIVKYLKEDPNLSLEEIAVKIGEPEKEKISSGYLILSDLLNKGGLKDTDYPLYFLTPVISGRVVKKEDFEGKVFFYGLTAAGTWDLNPMPYMDRYPMLGLHANAFNTMLQADFLRRFSKFQNILIMLGLGLLIGLIVPVFKPINAAVLMVVISIAYLVLAQYLFQSHGLWIDVLGPVTILLFGYTSATVYNFFSEEQEKKMIRGIFSRYVTKSVVDELIQNPDMVKLGGEKKVLTVFFSDVAGFTTISEALTPEELVALLNEYLTAMTNIVLSYDGMIDKYEGDAIMAVFGAPIPFDDHPTRACHVSLDMQKELINLRKKWKEENRPELYVRIGLNTGPMVVGNMGASDRFDYTVMGDSVNLGARLEGANKQYGTNIMISEFTYEMCKNDIESRFLDLLRVKGKNLPVTVYEVLAKKNDGLSGDIKKVVELYNQGIEYYKALDWDNGIKSFEEALKIDAHDGPSKVYLERCQQCKINPPPSDWDGVFVMTTK